MPPTPFTIDTCMFLMLDLESRQPRHRFVRLLVCKILDPQGGKRRRTAIETKQDQQTSRHKVMSVLTQILKFQFKIMKNGPPNEQKWSPNGPKRSPNEHLGGIDEHLGPQTGLWLTKLAPKVASRASKCPKGCPKVFPKGAKRDPKWIKTDPKNVSNFGLISEPIFDRFWIVFWTNTHRFW